VGVYSAISILGSAGALFVFGFIGDIPHSWRWFYGASILLLPLLFLFGRRVPESKRFLKMADDGTTTVPLDANSRRVYAFRLAACAAVSFCDGFAFAPNETFKIKKWIEVHNFTAAQVSLVSIGTGILAFSSFTLAGSLSDRYGRKRFLIVFNTMCGIGIIGFFLCPEGNILVYFFNFVSYLAGFVLSTVKMAYFAELFPTSRRASAQGVLVVSEFIAGGISLALESGLYLALNTHWTACAILATPALLAGPLIHFFLPDTSSQELESISPESVQAPNAAVLNDETYAPIIAAESVEEAAQLVEMTSVGGGKRM